LSFIGGKAMTLTIEATYKAAQELEQTGSKPASLKYALWIASLSGQKSLTANGQQARSLAKFVETPPRDESDIEWALRWSGNRFYSGRNVATIWYIQQLDDKGLLEPFKQEPKYWTGWRDGLFALLYGHGCSLKMISFAALLMWPTQANLAIIDSHMLHRYAVTNSKGKQVHSATPVVYMVTEDKVRQEWKQAGCPCSLGVFHWFLWSSWRQANDAEMVSDVPESHNLLSPRDY
jgi:thermostable 8-oxoguanine DNA glycosylase